MISKDRIKHVIISKQEDVQKYEIIPRDIPGSNYGQLVMVGARRSGKSYMLYQKMQELLSQGYGWNNMLFLDFEDERLDGFTLEDFDNMLICHAELYNETHPLLFLDEIQNIDGWERFARRMADTKHRIWITGSNQKMLSSEIQSRLGGRYITKEVYPYSFSEFLNANDVKHSPVDLYGTNNIANIQRYWNEYLYWGGMPYNADKPFNSPEKRDYLIDTYRKIYLNDIANRTGIPSTKSSHLRLLLKKMAESVHQPQSYTNFKNLLSSISGAVSQPTVVKYIEGCEDAWLILRLRNICSHLKERETSCKYYFIDNGILNLHLENGKGALLENAVALSLFRKYGHDADNQRVFFYRDNVEVDFYVPEDNLAIQAAYSIFEDDNTRQREVNALTKFEQYKPGNRRLIITNDETDVIEDEYGTIEVMPLWKWSLEEERKQNITNSDEIKNDYSENMNFKRGI